MRCIGKQYNAKSGIALYLAILIGTILMAIGLGVSTIFYRELRISGSQFPSLIAFYAADTGAECALYWDIQQDVFIDPTSSPTITCQGNPITVSGSSGFDSNGPFDFYTFHFDLSSGNACTNIRVKKQTVGGVGCTVLVSLGRDASCAGSPTVERGIISKDPEACAITTD